MSKSYVVARLEFKGHKFEILVDPEKAFRYINGEKIPIQEILISEEVYKDVRSGDRVSPEVLKKAFGTTDIFTIAETILKKGELQLTTEQRRKLLEAKRKQVINFIARNAIDPQTKLPIPPSRIEAAMAEAKVSIDPYKSVEEEAMKVVKAISRVIPIKIARSLLQIRVPPQYAGRAYPVIQKLGELKSADWKTDGTLVAEIEIPAGMQQDVIDKLNKVTKGEAEVKVLYTK
ncbi:RNA-associated protein [Ignicoccus islandicus DSM 13165]|uniref:RNA-associated protein n=1 Tax=Ignicoccus islandicus DSM 13165 TaxID=940295 RepID=A0A0U3F3E0_9CREN|nr:ribosome assembly factor SBDS [Ignicoccus islandicus]ALU12053.1 RNA-associated protein [Ignicoccus islandicus DSM 13165]